MKTRHYLVLLVLLFMTCQELSAQRVVVREEVRAQPRRDLVVVRSRYRPARVIVYRPYWRPHFTYHRRWVYFPRYNIYWDNWRNQYVWRNGNVWVSQATAPPVIVNVNLGRTRAVELNENEDDVDDIYKSNDAHRSSNKQS